MGSNPFQKPWLGDRKLFEKEKPSFLGFSILSFLFILLALLCCFGGIYINGSSTIRACLQRERVGKMLNRKGTEAREKSYS
jgi:hypothetical protein